MPAAIHVAVVEDEADLRDVVADYLRLHNFVVHPCPDGHALDAALATTVLDIVLLDLNLPREGGLSIARRLRRLPSPPGLIMVTALGEAMDRIVGLELGADDYIGKPFELRELLARIRSLLRRRAAMQPAQAPAATLAAEAPSPRDLRCGRFTLQTAARRLLAPDGSEVPLTTMELDLLLLLAARPGQVLSRERLLMLAHGKEVDPHDRSIDVRITRLRRKIEQDPTRPRLIRTIRGLGYVFEPDAT